MREPVLVDHAAHAPNACALCTNTQGPFADTFFEDRSGRKYLCKRCAKTGARVFGFAAGKRMDELSDAAALVEQKDAEVAKLVETMNELRLEFGAERARAKDLQDQLSTARGVLQATRHMAAQMEQAAHELVECVAPPAPVEVVAA